jgi:serine protease Do
MICLFLVVAVLPVWADDPDLAQATALEKVMQKAIAYAEPSIACILVSRNEEYRKYKQAVEPDDTTGRLGTFHWKSVDGSKFSKEQLDLLRKKLDLADPNVIPESFGSGVVVDPQGLILTNYHVVRDAIKIFVRLPGNKSAYADIHAADPRSDLAVLRVPATDLPNLQPKILPLKTIALGDGDKLQRGQFILSLANPFAAGFRDGQPSASWGILSNVRRRVPGQLREDERSRSLHQHGTLLQLDARLNLGSSGGAVLNLQGELVGLTTALAAIHGGETPGGFAIPLDANMKRIIEVLLRGEEVEYGFLGVGLKERSPEEPNGVAVNNLAPGSPADLEGKLRPNDRILAVNGVPIQESDDLFLQLGTQLAGSKVRLDVRRSNGAFHNLEVTLAKFYVPGKKIASSPGKRPFIRGLRVDFTSLLYQQPPRLLRIPAGVFISEVQPNSAAAEAQARVGEIISHVNGQLVTNPTTFYQLAQQVRGPMELTLAGLTHHDPSSKKEPASKIVLK